MSNTINSWLPRIDLLADKKWHDTEKPFISHNINAVTYILEKAKKSAPLNKTLFYAENHIKWSYRDFYVAVEKCSFLLRNKYQIKLEQRVLVHSYNCPELAVLWFAIVMAGGIIILTPPQLKSSEIKHILHDAEVKLLISANETIIETSNAIENNADCHLISLNDLFCEIKSINKTDSLPPNKTKKDDIALIAYTSGSSGLPKATVHTHEDIITICNTFPAEILKPSPSDIFAGTTPLGFTFGLGALLLFPIYYGASSVLLSKPSPMELSLTIDTFQVTMLFSTPTGYRMLLELFNPKVHRWKSLTTCVSAGEHLPASTSSKWKDRLNLPIINGIGSTEMLHIFISSKNDFYNKAASVGKPLKGYLAKIVDENGNELPDNSIGFLAVSGPTGCCYLKNDAAQARYVKNKWNITGDLFYKDGEGYFYFYDRADDLIITSGYKVSASEIESILLQHNEISETAVIGVNDKLRNQIIIAYIKLEMSVTQTEETINNIEKFVNFRVAKYKRPREYIVVNTIPKTNTGKKQRFKLRKRQ